MLRTALKPSRLLAAILAAVHAGALCLVLLTEIGWIVKVALCVLLVIQCVVALRRALLRGPAAAVALEISADDVLCIETRSAGWSEQSVLASTFVAPLLTVMNLCNPATAARCSVVLLPDSLPADDFRRLRVWLRWKAGHALTGDVP